jgi:dihydrofolate synthase/folylpolyglutamate synthase
MGGRLDATNVVEPKVSVITDISLDHQKFLGNTISEIAGEKAGIIRADGIVVTLPQSPEANIVIGQAILEKNATGMNAAQYVPPVTPMSACVWEDTAPSRAAELAPIPASAAEVRPPVSRYPLEVMGARILVETPLIGRHQLRNVALAIATAEQLSGQGFPITPDSIERGIRETRWPGRFQILPAINSFPETVFDVAHNPAGAWALRSALSSCYADRRLVFVFGAMRDKAIGEIAEILFPLAESVIAVAADNPRSATPQEIREAAARTGSDIESAETVASAIERARHLAGTSGVVVITGSIYVVGEAMQALGVSVDGK